MSRNNSGEKTGNEDVILSVDAILDLLAHHQRRAMLRLLRDAPDNEIPEDGLISHLQEVERDRTGTQPSWDHISATLHHIHDPKLSGAGLITYEESAAEYHYQPDSRIEKWLDHIESIHGEES